MDFKATVDRLKRYKAALHEAGLPRDGFDYILPNVPLPPAENHSFWFGMQVVVPLHDTFAFIVNNRLLRENIEYYMNQDAGPTLTPDALYTRLSTLLPDTAEAYLRTIDCGTALLDQIVAALFAADRPRFVTLLDDNNCPLTKVSNLCNHLWEKVTVPRELNFDEWRELHKSFVISDTSMLDPTQQDAFAAVNEMNEAASVWDNQENPEQYQNYIDKTTQFDHTYLRHLLFIYWDDPSQMLPEEREQIEEITHRPLAGALYDTLHCEYDTAQQNQPFTLPHDYFALPTPRSASSECLSMHIEIIKAGVEKFATLVNYLADKGYINHTDRQLFAYRFSAKQRPATVEPIEWHAPDCRPYELIYLVRILSERADYRKMRNFFTGPDWPARSTASYAKGASFELKTFVSELYPSIKKI